MVKESFRTEYVAPEFQSIEVLCEGVLCGSNEGVGEDDGTEWD